MVEAVRTTASTFEIWAIVVVAVFVLAVWLVGISVADNIQARESRRWWQRMHGPQAGLGSAESALGGAGAPAVPGQRRDGEQGGERGGEPVAAGQEAAAGEEAAAAQEAATGRPVLTRPIPAQSPAPESEPGTVAGRGRHARPTIDGTGDFRRDAAEANWRTDAPTRPDLPAQEAATGRHAMPAQRTGDTDRAERSLAGPDADRQGDEPGQG